MKPLQLDSQEFKEWFKNSKVVDKDKNPLSVYHGTTESFTEFKTSPLQKHSVNGIGQNAVGSCFSESQEIASCYPFSVRGEPKRKVLEVYLSIQNPKRYRTLLSLANDMIAFLKNKNLPTLSFDTYRRLENVNAFRNNLIEQGYDGITYLEGPPYKITKDKERVWVAFHPEQIKTIAEHEGKTYE